MREIDLKSHELEDRKQVLLEREDILKTKQRQLDQKMNDLAEQEAALEEKRQN